MLVAAAVTVTVQAPRVARSGSRPRAAPAGSTGASSATLTVAGREAGQVLGALAHRREVNRYLGGVARSVVTAALLCALGAPLMTPLSTSRARPGGRLGIAVGGGNVRVRASRPHRERERGGVADGGRGQVYRQGVGEPRSRSGALTVTPGAMRYAACAATATDQAAALAPVSVLAPSTAAKLMAAP